MLVHHCLRLQRANGGNGGGLPPQSGWLPATRGGAQHPAVGAGRAHAVERALPRGALLTNLNSCLKGAEP